MMEEFYLVKFSKSIEEDFLVDFINSILKNLSFRNYSFYLDNVLIGEKNYYFIFRIEKNNSEILVKEIDNCLPIQEHYFII